MNERTITLSDGSVWEYSPLSDEACRWSRWDHSGISRPCDFVGKEPHRSHGQPLTASDHRAIADVLEPRAAASGGEREAVAFDVRVMAVRDESGAATGYTIEVGNTYQSRGAADAVRDQVVAALRASGERDGEVTDSMVEALYFALCREESVVVDLTAESCRRALRAALSSRQEKP